METEKYLNNILKKEGLNDKSDEAEAIQTEKANVEETISDAFDGSPVVRYAGSYKKGTMIKASYDLDIACYFNRDDNSAGESLEEIFNNVQVALAKKYFVTPKRSALRLQNHDNKLDFHIDVVPGRFVDDTETDCFLHQTTGDKERLKTNLDVHISHIKNSGLTKTIQLVKIWRNMAHINVKTFVLELLIVKVMAKSKDSDGLGECLKTFFNKLSEGLENIAIEDPANSGNDLSPMFDDNVKNSLSWAAKIAMDFIEKEDWEKIFGQAEDESANKSGFGGYSTQEQSVHVKPAKPWLSSI